MKGIILSLFVSISPYFSICQKNIGIKTILDTSALNNWEQIPASGVLLSDDGGYVKYLHINQPGNRKVVSIIKSTDGKWKKELAYIGAEDGFFSPSSKYFYFKYRDSLFFMVLGTDSIIFKAPIQSWKRSKNCLNEWVAWLVTKENKLVVKNLNNENELKFDGVVDYSFGNCGSKMILKKSTELELIDLSSNTITKIWERDTKRIGSLVFDKNDNQILFVYRDSIIGNTIWYYKKGMKYAEQRISPMQKMPKTRMVISSDVSFRQSSNYFFFSTEDSFQTPSKLLSQVDVWSYHDKELQTVQTSGVSKSRWAYNINNGDIVMLNSTSESVIGYHADFAAVRSKISGDRFWLENLDSIWLISLKDGFKRYVTSGDDLFEGTFSPGGKWFFYYSKKKRQYIIINLLNFESYPLGQPGMFEYKDDYRLNKNSNVPVGIGGWFKNDSAVLVYDDFDIWTIILKRETKFTVLTNGFGRRSGIKLRLAEGDEFSDDFEINKDFVLIAFNNKNKMNGFYKIRVDSKRDPQLLTMGRYTYYHNVHNNTIPAHSHSPGMQPIKAKNVETWLVMRQSAAESPNLFITKDFKTFQAITNIVPEKKWNWLTSELIQWKQLNGIETEGVLYRPENFDAKKKYPLIIHYYQQMSFYCYEFLTPHYMATGDINIPWFVSRGYLVLVVDIYYTKSGGESAFNSVEAAARLFAKKSYVDGSQIGISGHSIGGGETNYIATHSKRLAAVLTGAGVSDAVSSALQLSGGIANKRGSRLGTYEESMGLLWESPNKYIENSPVLKANEVTAPILIFHCKADGAVPWEQALEFFISLRRLEKKVWLLQYDKGEHGVTQKQDMIDLTIRITQFFDHYLKGNPAPKWMTQGIPAKLKQIETGYSLDPSCTCGRDCKVCKKWNEKMKNDSPATMKEIEERKKQEHWIE